MSDPGTAGSLGSLPVGLAGEPGPLSQPSSPLAFLDEILSGPRPGAGEVYADFPLPGSQNSEFAQYGQHTGVVSAGTGEEDGHLAGVFDDVPVAAVAPPPPIGQEAAGAHAFDFSQDMPARPPSPVPLGRQQAKKRKVDLDVPVGRKDTSKGHCDDREMMYWTAVNVHLEGALESWHAVQRYAV